MYECHLTFDNVTETEEKLLLEHASKMGWKTSFINDDPDLGPGKRFFLTSHNSNGYDMWVKMNKTVESSPFPPVRSKIEHIVHDTKFGVNIEESFWD